MVSIEGFQHRSQPLVLGIVFRVDLSSLLGVLDQSLFVTDAQDVQSSSVDL